MGNAWEQLGWCVVAIIIIIVVVKSGSVLPACISRSFPSGITTLQRINVKEQSLRGIVFLSIL